MSTIPETLNPNSPEVAAKTARPVGDSPKTAHLANTVAGLSSFMAGRERRLRIQAARLAVGVDEHGSRLPVSKAPTRPMKRAA